MEILFNIFKKKIEIIKFIINLIDKLELSYNYLIEKFKYNCIFIVT